MKILVINGSAHAHSINERYALMVVEQLKEAGYSVEFTSIRSLNLPLFTGDESLESSASVAWRQRVEAAQAYVIFTPEYYHGMPAVLKNAFEHLKGKEMSYKPLLLAGATTTDWGTNSAQHSLYATFRTLGLFLFPDEVFIANASAVEQNDPAVERLRQVCERFCQFLSRFE